ncbi:hypothetical protein ACRRTK_008628 [Alexandromys fortis]
MATSGVVKSSEKKTQKRPADPAESQAARRVHRRPEQHEKALVAERRCLLIVSSLLQPVPLLNLMSTTNTLGSKSFEVEPKDDEPDSEQLVEFAYAASISGNSNNVPSLLEAAKRYQIEPVKKMCAGFSKEQIDASDCLV